MKTILTAVCLIGLAGGANAFELQHIRACNFGGIVNTAEVPPAAAPAETSANAEIEAAYSSVMNAFYSARVPAASGVLGDWEGRVFMQDKDGNWRAQSKSISFEKIVYPSDLGPLFQNDSSELLVTFPYYETILKRRVSIDDTGMSFQFRWDGVFNVTFREFKRGQDTFLAMQTDSFHAKGFAYGYFFRKPAGTNKQAYTGGLPTGDLFGPLPPYFHGVTPPLLQADGLAAQGTFEYSNRIIFYKEKAEARAAAEKAAAVICAAGREVLSVKAEELNGFYYTSVGFSGKKANIYRWDDDASSAEEAAEVIKRKTDRYKSEGYSILETKITKAGNKHFFFIICAKFH